MKFHLLLAAIIVSLSLFLPSAAFCVSPDAGTKSASFLKLASGARAAGMAGAFSAVSNGGSDAVYWNPASLACVVRKEASFMYSSYFEDISYGWAAFARPSREHGVFGVGLQYLSYGELDERDGAGDSTSDNSYYDMAVYLSYANVFELAGYGTLNYGLTLKYINSKIEDSASAIALDGGALFVLNDKLTAFALLFQNVGTGLQYDIRSEDLPFIFKIAVSRILFGNLIVDADINIPSDNDIYPAVGAEYKLSVNQEADLFIRAGYSTREKDLPGFAGFSAGFGARFSDYVFDYAFSPYGDLGSAHRISIGIKFGEIVSKSSGVKKRGRAYGQPKTIPARQQAAVEEEYYEPIKEAAKTAGSIVVLELSSQQIGQNERSAYTEMLRNAITSSERFKVLSKQGLGAVYSKNSIPSKDEIKQILKQTGAETVICGNIEKTGNTLEFKLYLYDEDLREKEFSFSCENSFRAVKNNLQETAKEF